MSLNTTFLFVSLVWGSVGLGYFIYGKRQQAWEPMIGGVLMMAASYFIGSVWLLSLVCLGLIGLVHLLLRRG